MKRDMNLARRILLEVEKWPPEGGGGQIDVQGYDQQTISYHIMLLSEAGLLKGRDASGVGDICWFVDRLTWEGHEFVEAARDDTRWKKAISTISEKGGSFVFDVIKQLLVDLIKQAVFGHP